MVHQNRTPDFARFMKHSLETYTNQTLLLFNIKNVFFFLIQNTSIVQTAEPYLSGTHLISSRNIHVASTQKKASITRHCLLFPQTRLSNFNRDENNFPQKTEKKKKRKRRARSFFQEKSKKRTRKLCGEETKKPFFFHVQKQTTRHLHSMSPPERSLLTHYFFLILFFHSIA